MIGKARSHQGREHIVAQHKILSICPVVGNIRLIKLCQAVISIGVCSGSFLGLFGILFDQIEAIHLALIISQKGTVRGMVNIRYLIAFMMQRHHLTFRIHSRCRTIRTGIGSKIIIEGAILLNEKHDMLNGYRLTMAEQRNTACNTTYQQHDYPHKANGYEWVAH